MEQEIRQLRTEKNWRNNSYTHVDLRNMPHGEALEIVKNQAPFFGLVVVDIDGPLIPRASSFRIYSVGELPGPSRDFLFSLKTANTPFIIYTARALVGRLALVLNEGGTLRERIMASARATELEATLLEEFDSLGISREQIIFPQGVQAWFFPLFKPGDILRNCRRIYSRLKELSFTNDCGHFAYLGDTKTDFLIFQRLITLLSPVTATYFQFPQAYPLGIC